MTFSESIPFLAGTEKDSAPDINFYNLKKAAMILRALTHKLRQQIIATIYVNKRLTVTEIYVKLRLEQSVASQHLSILRKARVVLTEREGKFIYYKINSLRLTEINQLSKNLLMLYSKKATLDPIIVLRKEDEFKCLFPGSINYN